MSRPKAIRVDAEAGRIDWDESGEARQAILEGSVDARYDPHCDRLIVLVRAPEGEAAVLLSMDGEQVGMVPAPVGYSLSHFADVEEPVLVGQGEAPHEGWQDWHFTVDKEGRALRRLGPAY